MAQRPIYFPLGGGMDLVTSPLAIPSGRVIASLNYEPVATGYRRLRGYERYNGAASPSDMDYYRADFTGGSGAAPASGGFIEDSDAPPNTASIISVTLTSGSWAGGDAAGYIVYIQQPSVDPLIPGILTINGGTSTATATVISTANPDLGSEALNTAASLGATALQRSFISAVTGTGPVRGIHHFNGVTYAVRDHSSGVARVYKSTANGWSQVTFSGYFDFTYDTATQTPPTTGNTISDANGGPSMGTVVSVKTISLVGTTATARLYYSSYSGSGWGIGDTLWSSGTSRGTLTTAGSIATLPTGGRFHFINHNFYGSSNLEAAYGVSGAGKAFEMTSTRLTSIPTGMATDTPTRVAAHKGHLVLAFPGGSLQFSSLGEPLVFDPVTGSGEIGIGDEITDLISIPNALAVLGEESINVLYGNDSADFTMENFSREAGALPYTAQRLGDVIYMDNRGLRNLSASRAFGNFSISAISRLIQPLIEDYRRDAVQPTASLVCRTAGQYWVFFDNGTALIVYMGDKNPSIMPVNLGITVTCAVSVEDDAEERLFVGAEDGYVYELNKGTSFDGAAIEYYIRLPFVHFGAPHLEKVAKRVVLDVEVPSSATIEVSADFNYGVENGSSVVTTNLTVGGAAIDNLGSNELYFASQIEAQAEAYLDGIFRNISLKIGGESSTEEAHTLNGATIFIVTRELNT